MLANATVRTIYDDFSSLQLRAEKKKTIRKQRVYNLPISHGNFLQVVRRCKTTLGERVGGGPGFVRAAVSLTLSSSLTLSRSPGPALLPCHQRAPGNWFPGPEHLSFVSTTRTHLPLRDVSLFSA